MACPAMCIGCVSAQPQAAYLGFKRPAFTVASELSGSQYFVEGVLVPAACLVGHEGGRAGGRAVARLATETPCAPARTRADGEGLGWGYGCGFATQAGKDGAGKALEC